MNNPPVDLDFSHKYDREHAEAYLKKHQDGLARKLSHRRDVQLARHALKLAGQPNLVLDLPCGADNSADMLAVACVGQPDGVVKRVRPLQTSAFAIDLPDSSVDNIFCMRLLHHIGEADDRRVLLREFHRVTRDSVILSLWVDGNFKAWKRRRMEARRVANGEQTGYQNRFVLPAETVEREFRDAGFVVQKHLDFIPLYHMWRVYILRKE
ncbi:class I SAM-dependent methyltransferase [Pseudomonas aeruginosa]|nr:class I SAM-dependent methyltransferase [Pseudomonas aeruginosa]